MRPYFLLSAILFFTMACGSKKKVIRATSPADKVAVKSVGSYYEVFPSHLQYDRPSLPENFHYRRLPNGLEVLVIENHAVPLVTVEIAVHNGSFTEDSTLDGLSHLYEHMFFKANRDYPNQESFMQRVKELGIVFNGTTSNERVNYFFTMPSRNVKEGLEFMRSAILGPLFLEEEMRKENVVVAGEFQRNESSPFFHLNFRLRQYLWQNNFTRKNPIGNYDVILNATPEIMRKIQHRYYYPNNSILVVAGDVKPDEIFQWAEELFGGWKSSEFDIFRKYPVPRFKPVPHNITFIETRQEARVPIYQQAYHGPSTLEDIKATYAADVFSYILGQKGSKFQKNLVDSGYALQANISYYTQRFVGPITIMMVPNPQRINEAILKLWEEIQKFDDPDYITDAQIERAKRMLVIEEKYGRERTTQLIHTVTFWWASASLDYFTSYPDEIQKVTRQDIVNYVRKYIIGNHYVGGLLVPSTIRSAIDSVRVIRDLKYIHQYRVEVPQGEKFDPKSYKDLVGDLLFILRLNPGYGIGVRAEGPEADNIGKVLLEALRKERESFGLPNAMFALDARSSKGPITVLTFELIPIPQTTK